MINNSRRPNFIVSLEIRTGLVWSECLSVWVIADRQFVDDCVIFLSSESSTYEIISNGLCKFQRVE